MTDQSKPPEPDNVIPESELARRGFIRDQVGQLNTAIVLIANAYQALESANVPIATWLPMVVTQLPEPQSERFGKDLHYGAIVVEAAAAIIRGESVYDLMPRVIAALTAGSPAAGFGGALAARLLGVTKPDHDWPRPPGFPRMPIGGEQELRDLMSGSDAVRDELTLGHIDDTTKAVRMRQTIARLFATAPRLLLANGEEDPSQAPALQCHVVLDASVPPIEGVLSTTPEGGLRLMTPTEVDGPKDPNAHPRMPAPKKMVMLEQFFDYGDVVAICVQRDITATPSTSSIIS